MRSCEAIKRAAALALLVLLAAGCGEMPRPFQHNMVGVNNPLVRLDDGAGIFVRPVADLPAGESKALSEAMAAALRDSNIPATTRAANADSYVVEGRLEEPVTGRLRDITFLLRDQRGESLGGHRSMFVPASDMILTKPDGWEPVARVTANAIARILQPPVKEAAQAAPTLPRVHLRDVKGTPKDGELAMRRAVEFGLRREKVEVAAAAGDGVFAVSGEIRMTARTQALQLVEVKWTVLAPDGRQLGVVNQANEVPSALIADAWGEVAAVIAEGAVEGILDLLDQAAL